MPARKASRLCWGLEAKSRSVSSARSRLAGLPRPAPRVAESHQGQAAEVAVALRMVHVGQEVLQADGQAVAG
jgi:hypothetical protein